MLALSALITYASLIVFVLLKVKGGHAADLFTFWLVQFALGIVLAHVREHDPQRLRHLTGIGASLLGLGLVMVSTLPFLRRLQPYPQQLSRLLGMLLHELLHIGHHLLIGLQLRLRLRG